MDIVLKYICMPMAIATLKHNEKLYDYDKFKIMPLYLNLHESLIKAIEKDFYEFKKDVITTNHHLDIRKQSAGKYVVNGENMEFTAEELREGTKKVIQSYMYGENMIEIDYKEIPLEPKYTPPDVDSEDNR
ncbi:MULTISPECIES: hypothetical protein [unclassified Oceanobacillus]|uniref:hypothetical protein n=1 Tax=unclassified Oceanobacillus TaxID=2630292 RepID=UPI001BEB2154|nr:MULTISPECIES: hypothetical protein [unclassified Oceanobacillus]MBT2600927.1 hypothetical protein [Oceanobacillus sp. ISL-74]MBT2653622.1 hypothetical protein [Oceanobacillus sp. ISL-73]